MDDGLKEQPLQGVAATVEINTFTTNPALSTKERDLLVQQTDTDTLLATLIQLETTVHEISPEANEEECTRAFQTLLLASSAVTFKPKEKALAMESARIFKEYADHAQFLYSADELTSLYVALERILLPPYDKSNPEAVAVQTDSTIIESAVPMILNAIAQEDALEKENSYGVPVIHSSCSRILSELANTYPNRFPFIMDAVFTAISKTPESEESYARLAARIVAKEEKNFKRRKEQQPQKAHHIENEITRFSIFEGFKKHLEHARQSGRIRTPQDKV